MIILIILQLFFTNFDNNIDCKCETPDSVEEALKLSNTVILGKVVKKTLVSPIETMDEKKRNLIDTNDYSLKGKWIIKADIEITNTFKGDTTSKRTIVYSSNLGASCGFRFLEGKTYVIYGNNKSYLYSLLIRDKKITEGLEKEGAFWTSHCTRTTDDWEYEALELEKMKCPPQYKH
jgi:hypothetical protein